MNSSSEKQSEAPKLEDHFIWQIIISVIFIALFIAILYYSTAFQGPWSIYFFSMPLSILSFILGIAVGRSNSKQLYLWRKNGTTPPKWLKVSYIFAIIALTSPIWPFVWHPLTLQIGIGVNSKMNTIDEFRVQAENCNIMGVDAVRNGYTHRAPDASFYISVSPRESGHILYYSIKQKDELYKIFTSYLDTCPLYRKNDPSINGPVWNVNENNPGSESF